MPAELLHCSRIEDRLKGPEQPSHDGCSIGTRGRRGFRGVPLAQNCNVFQRQAEARLQFGVIDVDEPLADSFLTRIVAGPNQPADEPDRVTSGLAENAVSTFREN